MNVLLKTEYNGFICSHILTLYICRRTKNSHFTKSKIPCLEFQFTNRSSNIFLEII